MAEKVIAAYTVAEAAKLLKVTPSMVYRWINDGTLTEMHLAGGNTRLVAKGAVDKLAAARAQEN
jgi:excisionase family DNA binding protein